MIYGFRTGSALSDKVNRSNSSGFLAKRSSIIATVGSSVFPPDFFDPELPIIS